MKNLLVRLSIPLFPLRRILEISLVCESAVVYRGRPFQDQSGQFLNAAPNQISPRPRTAIVLPEFLAEARQYLNAGRDLPHAAPARLVRAWETFYTLCDPLVRRTIAGCRVSRDDRDDYAQEAWAEITASLGQFDWDPDRGSFETWLRTIVQRTVWRLETRIHRSTSHRIEMDLRSLRCHQNLEPLPAVTLRELRDGVQDALESFRARIPEASYLVLTLRYIEGRTSIEIGERLDMPAAGVRVLLQRTLVKFRRFLATADGLVEDRFDGAMAGP